MIEARRDGSDRLLFKLEGALDEKAAEDLKQQFRNSDSIVIKEVVFDFSAVTYIGSAGIGKLLLVYKDVAGRGGSVRFERVPQQIYEMFKVLKLDAIFTITH